MKYLFLLSLLLLSCSMQDEKFVDNILGKYKVIDNNEIIIVLGDGDIVDGNSYKELFDFKYANNATNGVYEINHTDVYIPIVVKGIDLYIGEPKASKKNVNFQSVKKYAERV